MFNSPELASWLWKRLEPIYDYPRITDEYGDIWQSYGLNSMFRFVRYDENDEFFPHEDGFYQEDFDKRSFATAIVYLNDVDEERGGSTEFLHHSIKLFPKEGLGFVFLVDGIFHKGSTLKTGVKYILRSDVMYRAKSLKNPVLKKKIFKVFKEADDLEGVDGKETECNDLWTKCFELQEEYRQHK